MAKTLQKIGQKTVLLRTVGVQVWARNIGNWNEAPKSKVLTLTGWADLTKIKSPLSRTTWLFQVAEIMAQDPKTESSIGSIAPKYWTLCCLQLSVLIWPTWEVQVWLWTPKFATLGAGPQKPWNMASKQTSCNPKPRLQTYILDYILYTVF